MNLDKLDKQIPGSVLAQIPAVIKLFKIDTPLKLAHFLAQCAHESNNFTAVVENLNYSADGLKKTFPKYFPATSSLCDTYARKPEAIASRVYASRMGNGDEASKDGWKYRGRGYIQLTGKDNFKAFNKFVEVDVLTSPDLVATKYPLVSAAWFFYNKKVIYQGKSMSLVDLCNQGADSLLIAVTKAVNGGSNGLLDRTKYFNRFYPLLKEQKPE
jgi:putative chitinase